MTGVHPCCVLLHSSSVYTRGYQYSEVSACICAKEHQKKLYFGALCVCWGAHIGQGCNQMSADMTRTICTPTPKYPIFSSSEYKWLHTRSHTHNNTQIQTAKKSKHSGALRTEGQGLDGEKQYGFWFRREDMKSQDTASDTAFFSPFIIN